MMTTDFNIFGEPHKKAIKKSLSHFIRTEIFNSFMSSMSSALTLV